MNTFRRLAVSATVCICALIASAQERQSVDLSVLESKISGQCNVIEGKSICAGILQIKATVGGRTFWMESGKAKDGLLELGNYKAYELIQGRKAPYKFTKTFELVYPDGNKEVLSVIGETK